MKNAKIGVFLTLFSLICAIAVPLKAQQTMQLLAAREVHQMQPGPEKAALLRAIERNGWYKIDTFYGLDNKMSLEKTDLSPFVDETGESVFLVSYINPEFPGGATSLADYLQNLLGDILAKPEESVQNTLYIRFSVNKDGRITETQPAQPFPAWVPSTKAIRCLEAVRDMPAWVPGRYKDQPVKFSMLLTFGMRE